MASILIRSLLVLILLGLAFSGPVAAAEPEKPAPRKAPLSIDERAPDFSLNDVAGKSQTLADLTARGPVVLMVLRGWVGYQCPVCTRQMAEFLASAKDIEAASASVVLVYPGPAAGLDEHARQFIRGKTFPASFHFLVDPDLAFTQSYGLRWDAPRETAYPSTFVIDRKQIVRFAKVSQNHGGRASAAEVLAALKTLPPAP